MYNKIYLYCDNVSPVVVAWFFFFSVNLSSILKMVLKEKFIGRKHLTSFVSSATFQY